MFGLSRWFLLIPAAALYWMFSGPDATDPGEEFGELYVDQKGVHWRLYERLPQFWSARTKGYGGMYPTGYVSRAQARENIEGNAAMRDPATGNIL